MAKPILCLDFDGVLHSYSSGWQGPRCIPDPPVPGALEFLVKAVKTFDVHIFSSRSGCIGGRRAMRRWLTRCYLRLCPLYDLTPDWLKNVIGETAYADPWDYEARSAIRRLVSQIKFPRHKPPAKISLDDRAICFTGEFPDCLDLLDFTPWHKKAKQQNAL
jgi:hypothetical protein